MNQLKLFVVGESSSDPEQWDEFGWRAIVIAHDAEEASRLTEHSYHATEILLDAPKVLLVEKNYGD